jgi:hypothetical protein
MRGTVLALFPLMLVPGVGRAQAVDSLSQGTIIRVSHGCGDGAAPASPHAGCRRERGAFVAVSSAGLTWRPGGSSTAQLTPWRQIGELDVSRGRHGHAGTGAAVGAVVGAIPGALSGMAYAEVVCECSHPNYVGGALMGALIFAGPGALAGAIIGQLVRTERWDAAPVERLRVSVHPGAEGVQIGLTLRF